MNERKRYENVPSNYWVEVKTWAIQCAECGRQHIQTGVFWDFPKGWAYGNTVKVFEGPPLYCPECAEELGLEPVP